MARTKPGEERRADLLDAAEALLVARGDDRFTIDDIVGGAGVAKGTFYLYFANKGELFVALKERFVQSFSDEQCAAARATGGAEGIVRWLQVGVDTYLREADLHDVLFRLPTPASFVVPNTIVSDLHALLLELHTPPAAPAVTATLLYYLMHGGTDHIRDAPQDEASVRAELQRLCLAALQQ